MRLLFHARRAGRQVRWTHQPILKRIKSLSTVDLWEVQQHPEKLAGIKPIKAERLVA